MKALSIRQPWAWLIVNGHKDIENRSWRTNHDGPFLIHASKGMTRREYEEARQFAESQGVQIPASDELERGGIVGQASLSHCYQGHHSPWYFGPWGWHLYDARPLPFRPCKGRLGFFDVCDAEGQQS